VEILFRGRSLKDYEVKDCDGTVLRKIKKGDWVEGYYHYYYDTYIKYTQTVHSEPPLTGDYELDIEYAGYDLVYETEPIDIEVDPKTVDQYTGKKDIEDNKIFESDIVKSDVFGRKRVRVVERCNYTGGFSEYTAPHASIIGNIHDNPELLEEN